MKTVIIGGGAAGLFAAIHCKTRTPDAQVIVLEKTNQLLAKVKISGGGRCNVTHACFDPDQLIRNYPRGGKELLGPFHTFQPKDTVAWFVERGVLLKAEEDGRMFPITDSSETIIDCLLQAAAEAGVEIRKQQKIRSVQKRKEEFVVALDSEEIAAKSVLLATGSSSWGYDVAKSFGHSIVEPVPSLFTFNVPTSPLLDLAGISVPNATLSIQGSCLKQKGAVLLTHWGFSGPAALKLSAWAARELHGMGYCATLMVNWTSAENQEILYQSLLQKKQKMPLQSISFELPNKLLARLLEEHAGVPMGKIPNRALAKIAQKLCTDAYQINGKTTYKQEFVTAGGVNLKEVDFKTMQSKCTSGLFFAGEILNIDGVTGGFNFQNAWTTGFLAGTALLAKK